MRAALPAVGGAGARLRQSVSDRLTTTTTTRENIFIMGPQNAAPKTPQDTLYSYFDDSAAAVRQTFSRYAPSLCNTRSFNPQHYARVEKSYVLPIVDLIRSLFLAYPISFVSFLNVFLTSSI